MADMISYLDPRVLHVHPRNAEFFDDINGEEFDRLVESVREHGILTPLRVTKDMTIISGHQRMRAAIEAECFTVPVIIDETEDDNDILMKLIETNFGRMKNDPIKQAKWVEEYMRLKGVQAGGGRPKKLLKNSTISQEDIAKELGVDRTTLINLKNLLTLDPTLQAFISDGNINASTGYKVLVKLSPDEQQKLIEKLPEGVKLSDKAVREYIEKMRGEINANTSKAMQERDKAIGEADKLRRENDELRKNSSDEQQKKIDKLEQERRDYYEQAKHLKDETARLRGEIDKALQAKHLAEAKANGGDDAVIELENRIDELQRKLEAEERKSNDLAFQLEEKDEHISDLEREKKEGFERKALQINETPEELSQREQDALVSDIHIAAGQFETKVNGLLMDKDKFRAIDTEVLKTLVEIFTKALSAGEQLKTALMLSSGSGNVMGYTSFPAAPVREYEDYGIEPSDIGLEI